MIEAAELDEAIDDTIAVCQEHRESGIVAKLASYGLDFAHVQEIIQRRWRDYSGDDPTAKEAFVMGYTEALMVGRSLERRAA